MWAKHRDCYHINMCLEAFIDGEVPSIEAVRINSHLEVCDDCAVEYQNALLVKKTLRGLPPLEAPELMPKLEQVRHAARLRKKRRQVMIPLAAGMLIALVLTPFITKTAFKKSQEAKLEQSVQDARYAFALVAKISKQAGLLPDKADTSRNCLIPQLKQTSGRLRHYLGEVHTSRMFSTKRSLK